MEKEAVNGQRDGAGRAAPPLRTDLDGIEGAPSPSRADARYGQVKYSRKALFTVFPEGLDSEQLG